MKIIGYQASSFRTRDGKTISGVFLFLSEERKNVVGVATERIFLSDAKLGDYDPQLGDEVKPFYNRYGKVESLEVM